MQYKTKRVPFELKNFDQETGIFTGYAAVFGNVDDGGDLIQPGAFTKTLKHNKDRIKICWQHDPYSPIGKPIEMKEDKKGLFVKGQISNTSLGKDVKILLKDGVINELSIGYDTVKKEWKDGVRHLKELKLYEFSPVTWAMNDEALITSVKANEDIKEVLTKTIELLDRLLEKTEVKEKDSSELEMERLVTSIDSLEKNIGNKLKKAN
ncbi:prohead peptidase [Orenia metallireducens]|uniref:Prohead serine protease domain-containing protein n=1 Tax=Orenia metallireducens TaxID=1413210 RepID=A0A285IIN9_9FIRM|nr:HK97 family phage prohead protease [Orenia metallireducens]PRX16932.1 prohead peptidase [Orenia metallireducens]SNY47814.1 prohead peptidase. Unknown type peptidase. MEROPS family U35 [Orenia metallireducens]